QGGRGRSPAAPSARHCPTRENRRSAWSWRWRRRRRRRWVVAFRRRSRNRSDKGIRGRDRAEHAALHLDHLQRMLVVALVGRAAAIVQQYAFEAAVVRLAHGGVDADVGGNA